MFNSSKGTAAFIKSIECIVKYRTYLVKVRYFSTKAHYKNIYSDKGEL